MNIRKEPALFVVVAALAAWIWSGQSTQRLPRSANTRSMELEAAADPAVVLADLAGREAAASGRDLFREPTEATPLPPRDLPFPPLVALPVVAMPLSPGQDAGAWYQLRIDGGDPTPHEFAAPAASAGGNESGDLGPGGGESDQGLPDEVMIERFDRIWLVGGGRPFFGNILHQDKLSLPPGGPFLETVRFESVSRQTGRVSGTLEFEPAKVERIAFAESLENAIALRKRDLPTGPAGLVPREEFLRFLLDAAREREWVWKEAEEQAAAIFAVAPDEGYRAKLRVQRAKGDLAAELAIFQDLPTDLADSAARWREQGSFEARLGLPKDAEEHLRLAVTKGPTDARSNAALAEFLLARGRSEEAVPFAEAAARSAAQVTDEGDRFDVIRTWVAALLAVGRVEDAQLAVTRATTGPAAEQAYLRGAVHYASGELEQAVTQFEKAADELPRLDAVLGLGACALREGRFDEARQLFERVRDEAPALRGRALAGLGLLYERTGHAAESAEALTAAEAAAPRDPYVLYLLGRRQRLDGQLEDAVTTERRALAERDELVEALAEIARAQLARVDAADGDAAEILARTVRYVDRLVGLDQARGRHVPFLELQGYVLARIGDVAQARRAFAAGYEAQSSFCEVGLALLDYRQKRVGDARQKLAQLSADPSRGGEIREFARATVDLIDDHASKELVRDTFDRDVLGDLWTRIGSLAPVLRDQQLTFRGQSGRVGEDSAVRRVVRAGDFLRCEVRMDILGDLGTTEFAGLRLTPETQRGGSFQVELGLKSYGANRQPELRLVDGPPAREDSVTVKPLDVEVGVGQPVVLAVEFVQAIDASDKSLTLRVLWNGEVVDERPIKTLRSNSAQPLATDFVVRGRPVHVRFDDYRLERRKETR
ncbi:MAG: tetratricopeptide repeat protein [Planctomycetota bacterium]